MTTTMIADFTLPQRSVLDSDDGLSRDGPTRGASRPLPARQPDVVLHLAQHHPARRAGGAMHRPGSDRLRPIRQARHRLSLRGSGALSRRLHRSAGIGSAYLVAQDWGTALAFHLAARRPDFVRGLAFMEFIRPMPTWDDFHQVPAARETFRKFRTPGEGEQMILDGNAFVERVLPGSILRKLSEEEMAVYRAPFPTPESRRPTWRLPNELPIAGEPADVYATLERAHAALASSHYPKLLFAGRPRRARLARLCRTFCFRPA